MVWTATGAPPPIGTPPTHIWRFEAMFRGYPSLPAALAARAHARGHNGNLLVGGLGRASYMCTMPRAFALAIVTALLAGSPAAAGVPHVVQPGETLWTIAAANNFTTRSLAAANGLSENSNVVLGSTIQIPSISEASAALANAGITGNTS